MTGRVSKMTAKMAQAIGRAAGPYGHVKADTEFENGGKALRHNLLNQNKDLIGTTQRNALFVGMRSVVTRGSRDLQVQGNGDRPS